MELKAKTELFQRIEQWRRERGRNPDNGSKKTAGPKRCQKHIDATDLVILALRIAVDRTNRDDLRPLYQELADELENKYPVC